jgi:hypothetical protein
MPGPRPLPQKAQDVRNAAAFTPGEVACGLLPGLSWRACFAADGSGASLVICRFPSISVNL